MLPPLFHSGSFCGSAHALAHQVRVSCREQGVALIIPGTGAAAFYRHRKTSAQTRICAAFFCEFCGFRRCNHAGRTAGAFSNDANTLPMFTSGNLPLTESTCGASVSNRGERSPRP